MTVPRDALVFDTGPLRHFAEQNWLGILRFLAGGRPVFMPDTVARELSDVADEVQGVRAVLNAPWIETFRSTDLEYAKPFASLRDRLVVGTTNLGECGVLAMGVAFGAEVVIDDSIPRNIALEEGLRVTATVPLLCEAIRAKRLTTVLVEAVADDLLESEYFLPFGRGGFRQHVIENGLLDWEDLQ